MFALTESIAEDIAFAMEDQNDDALIDTETGKIASPGLDEDFPEGADDDDPATADSSRWASLPPWSSADGYKLMERFRAAQRQEEAKRAMAVALSSRKGVFKAFKESLAAFPDLQNRFFHYKDLEMRRSIRRWYLGLLAEAGEEGGSDPEAYVADIAACEIRVIQSDRALRLLDALLPREGLGIASIPIGTVPIGTELEFRDLLYAECSSRLERATQARKGLLLEARIPGMDEDAPDEADSLGLLLAERVSLGKGHDGVSIFFIQSFPEYRNTAIEAALVKGLQAMKKGPFVICSYARDLLVEPNTP
jgi:hypothetical protein